MDTEDVYDPVQRDRDSEKQRCEATIPGYREMRHHPTWNEVKEEFMRDLEQPSL